MGENRWLKNGFVYVLLLVGALALFLQYFQASGAPNDDRGIYEILNDAKAGKVATIVAQSGSNDIIVTYKDLSLIHI